MIDGNRASLTREQLVAGVALAVFVRWLRGFGAAICAFFILLYWLAMSPPSWPNMIAGLINAVVTWRVLKP